MSKLPEQEDGELESERSRDERRKRGHEWSNDGFSCLLLSPRWLYGSGEWIWGGGSASSTNTQKLESLGQHLPRLCHQ